MSNGTGGFSIVLSGGNAAAIAPAMAKLFGIDQRLAGQIAGASPIVLVENLTEGQAAGVSAALNDLVAAGARIEVKSGSLGSIPKVGWPGEPTVGGKPVAGFTAPPAAAPGTFCCPSCGANFRLVQEGAGGAGAAPVPVPAAVPVAAPPPPPPPPPPAAAPVKMTVKDSGFEEIPLPDALKALEAEDLPDVPEVPSAPKPAAPPSDMPSPVPMPKGGAMPVSQVKPGHSAPMALEDFEKGLAADDDVLADLDDGLPDVPEEKPRPVPAKPAARKALAAGKPDAAKVQGMDQIQVEDAPEQAKVNLQPKSAKAAKPISPAKAAKAAKVAAAKPARPASTGATKAPSTGATAAGGGDPGEKVNIYTGKSNSPKLHELLAKIQGISVEEAAEVAAKTIVPVAKGISRKQAEVIKEKLNANKISVRITPARASQRMKPAE